MTWEQRWHPLREEWVIVAAHRQDRPWKGERARGPCEQVPHHDPDCPFCPGNTRSGGRSNPGYEGVWVFDNDHPCVGPHAPRDLPPPPAGYRSRPATGLSRVVCYDPRHDLSLARLGAERVAELLRTWQEQVEELGARPGVEHVFVFENRGEATGVSNPHPHGQIYATNFVFKTIANEVETSRRYRRERGRLLFGDVIDAEVADGRRIIAERDGALAFVPWFARHAYETYVAPRARHGDVTGLGPRELDDLAGVLHEVLVRFDNLWNMPFPYVMALHQAPTDGADHDDFWFHVELHPPLRKPGLLKYLAGPEVGGGSFLADTCPEEKAAELRAVPGVHDSDSDT